MSACLIKLVLTEQALHLLKFGSVQTLLDAI